MKKTNKRINRQSLFLEFLQNKFLVKMDAQDNPDYCVSEKPADPDFYCPDNKLRFFSNITRGNAYYKDNKEGSEYRIYYGLTYNLDCILLEKAQKEMDTKDIFLFELFQECKNNQKSELSTSFIENAIIYIACKFFDDNEFIELLKIKMERSWGSNVEKYLNEFIEIYSFLDFEKYQNFLLKESSEVQKDIFCRLLNRFSFDSAIQNYYDILEARKNKIVSFSSKKEQKEIEKLEASKKINNLFNEQLSFIDSVDSKLLRKSTHQMSIFEA